MTRGRSSDHTNLVAFAFLEELALRPLVHRSVDQLAFTRNSSETMRELTLTTAVTVPIATRLYTQKKTQT